MTDFATDTLDTIREDDDEAPEGWTDIEVFIYLNEDGDAAAACDDDAAFEDFNDNIGGENRKLVKIKLRVQKPKTLTASATLPEDASEVSFEFKVA